MSKIILVIIFGVAITLSLHTLAISQETGQEVIFIFESKEVLSNQINNFESDKTIKFEISGLESNQQAAELVQSFKSFSSLILSFEISELTENNLRSGVLSLDKTVRMSYFTKLLITYEIRSIIVDGKKIKTETLNG